MFEREDPGTEPENEGQASESVDTPETTEPENTAADTEEGREKPAPAQQARGKDPTEGMTPEQQVTYWKKRYGGAMQDVSRLKQQRGGLANRSQTSDFRPQTSGQANGQAPVKSLDEVQTLPEFLALAKQEITQEVEQRMTNAQMNQRVDMTEKQARETHDGSDGYPPYDEVVDDVVAPMIEKNPRIFEILKMMDNPAEAAYTLGVILKYKNFKGLVESHARDDLVKNINKQGKVAASVKGRGSGRQPTTKLTAAEIDSMTPEQFEKELDRYKNANS